MGVPLTIQLVKGTRKVKVHFFVHDATGPIQTDASPDMVIQLAQHGVPVPDAMRGGVRGFAACQPKRKQLGGVMENGRYVLFPCTAEVQGVTCQECQATRWFQKAANTLVEVFSETE